MGIRVSARASTNSRGVTNIDDWDGRPLKRAWRHPQFLSFLPSKSLRILDLGCGSRPVPTRRGDIRVTVDISPTVGPSVICDVSSQWPFAAEVFDVIYASHAIEHFYPQDRDWLVWRIFDALKEGGIFFFRVPHKSGFQATGWEHHTTYGTNGADGLWRGENPLLPVFEQISTGVAFCDQTTYFLPQSGATRLLEDVYNVSFRLTDRYLARVIRIPEVQFMLRKPKQKRPACDYSL
jgi:SAM-dependent methyltransferase